MPPGTKGQHTEGLVTGPEAVEGWGMGMIEADVAKVQWVTCEVPEVC